MDIIINIKQPVLFWSMFTSIHCTIWYFKIWCKFIFIFTLLKFTPASQYNWPNIMSYTTKVVTSKEFKAGNLLTFLRLCTITAVIAILMVIHEGVIVPPDCFGVNGLTSVVQLPLNIITSMCMILVHAKKKAIHKGPYSQKWTNYSPGLIWASPGLNLVHLWEYGPKSIETTKSRGTITLSLHVGWHNGVKARFKRHSLAYFIDVGSILSFGNIKLTIYNTETTK